MAKQPIEAAGVVLVRAGEHGPEVAVVHRPHRSDWSLPKGKLEPGERHDVAAVREAFEETGVRCALGPSLGSRRYRVEGTPKHVRYWRARVLVEEALPAGSEIDEVRWLRRKAAKALLTYADDRTLVDAALALPDTEALVVLRHAEATKRADWRGSGDPLADIDAQRPLNAAGVHQAHGLAEVLAAYAPRRVVSSDARRCRATVEPYADLVGLPLEVVHALSEEGSEDDPSATAAAVKELLGDPTAAVWCTHRPVLPLVLRELARRLDLERDDPALDPRLKPGSAVLVHRTGDGTAVAVDRLESGP